MVHVHAASFGFHQAGFSKLADLLNGGGLLRDVTRLVSERFFSPDHIHTVLDDMRSMYENGHFNKLFLLLQMAVEEPYHMHELLDPALSGMLASSKTDFALLGLGRFLGSSSYASGASAAVGVWRRPRRCVRESTAANAQGLLGRALAIRSQQQSLRPQRGTR